MKAILFDAYGTLLDVHSVIELAETCAPGRGTALSQAWRAKQLEYTWLRTLSNRYRDFWQVTGDALDWAAIALGVTLAPVERQALLDAYLDLRAFPENAGVLEQLHRDGFVLGTLSNGSPAMLESALVSAGLRRWLTHVLSVDTVGCFKTDPRAYAIGTAALGTAAADIVFVSSNCWDAIGATWFGYRAFWVNRANAPLEQLGAVPAGTGSSLCDLPAFVT